jgi:hypothetical protein
VELQGPLGLAWFRIGVGFSQSKTFRFFSFHEFSFSGKHERSAQSAEISLGPGPLQGDVARMSLHILEYKVLCLLAAIVVGSHCTRSIAVATPLIVGLFKTLDVA